MGNIVGLGAKIYTFGIIIENYIFYRFSIV